MRVLLLMITVLVSVFSRAQAVFEIEAPSSIKGFYKFGLSDSTIDYRWGNGNTAKKSISASLALGKDSLAREALELNVKGKIAVLYRGGAAFTDIALRAQTAGAVAVIVVNNRPLSDAAQGGAWSMAVSTGSEKLTIPLIMVSQEDGALITNEIRKGGDVKGYIGKKRMLNFDVKVTEDWMGTPLYRTRPVFLAKKGMISDTLGLSVINNGSQDVKNVIVVADISFGGKSIYADTLLEDSLAASGSVNGGDTMYYRFSRPFEPDFDLPSGTYTLKYTLHQLKVNGQDTTIVKLEDDFKDDNEVEAYFTISDSTLAIGNTISYTSTTNNKTYTNKGNWSTASNTGANLKNFKSCIVFKNHNADKVNINSMDFLAYNFDANGTLQNSKVGIEVYKWKPAASTIFDPNFTLTINDLTAEIETEYTFKDALKSDYGTYSFANDGLTLEADGMYLFCVSTTTPSIGFGFNSKYEPNMWPSIAFNNQYLMPVYSDGTFYRTGFGSDMIPAITLNFSEKSLKSSSKDIISYSIVSPALNAKVGVDQVTLEVPNSTDVTKLVSKFKLSPKAVMTINSVKQVSDTTVNDFTNALTATVTAEDGSTKTYQIIITKAAKSSDNIIVSCKQGSSFGLIENDKVTFNLPTGTDLTKLVFTYAVSPFAKAYIFDSLGTDKDSTFTTDVTAVNASGAVKIKVVAEDGSVRYYDLIVKIVKSTSKLITAFSVKTPAVTGTIVDNLITLSVPKGTDVTKLVTNFTASAKSKVYVGDSIQTTGVTSNDFSDTVSYKVVAEDGSSVIYKVVVTVLKSTGNSITKFAFVDPAVSGVINGLNITVKVPKATDFTSLIATFEVSADAIVKVDNTLQVSGVTVNDFTNPLSYIVTSESGTSKTYIVTVEEEATSGLSELSNTIKVLPNPSTGKFNVVAAQGSMDVVVTDMAGKVVYNYSNTNHTVITHTFDISNVEAGVYVAKIVNNGETSIVKLQVTK